MARWRDSILISLTLLLATATATCAQDVGRNQRTEQRNLPAQKEVKARELNGKQAPTEPESSNATQRAVARPDFKVLVWYRRDDPLGTFKYEVYDLRKGEYTVAVDTWLKNIENNYPAYRVAVRSVDLKRERGETEMLKVGSVIKRDLLVAAGMAGVFVDGGASASPGLSLGMSRVPGPGASGGSLNRSPGSAGSDRSYLNPTESPFPVPIPYPRPHP